MCQNGSIFNLIFNTQLVIVKRVRIHPHVLEDLEDENVPDEVVANILSLLEQMQADPLVVDKLTTHGNNDFSNTTVNVKRWETTRSHLRDDLWRFRILDCPATTYRIVYGYEMKARKIHVLAVVHKEKFDYDDHDTPIAKRILADWMAIL